MNTELQMLVLCALLAVAQALLTLFPVLFGEGFRYALGNRERPPSLPEWGKRAGRAHRNMLEQFPPFAALVLAAQAAGISNEATAWGATLFFWGRLAHAVTYTAGIPYLRTLAFLVAIGGMFDIARALIEVWLAGPGAPAL